MIILRLALLCANNSYRPDILETFSSFPVALVSSFSLIGLAEMGDKSQLVCIALAVRYRAIPVLMGATAAFALLNLAAVLIGAAVANWLPEHIITVLVGVLFLLFGAHAFRSNAEEESDVIDDKGNHSIFFSTFLLIILAEFGDKTQIAVAGLASTVDIVAVWLGATLALTVTSAIGVLAGRTILQRVPVILLHRLSGSLFILFGISALLSLWW